MAVRLNPCLVSIQIIWRDRYSSYNERMAAIGKRTRAWYVSPLVDRLSLVPIN